MSLVPQSVVAFVALDVAALYWLALHVVSTVVAGPLVTKSRFPWADAGPYFSAAKRSLLNVVLGPLNMVVMFLSNAVTFLLGAWTYVALGALLVLGGYFLTNYQVQTVTTVDAAWSALYATTVEPVRYVLNVLFVFLEIVVGVVNFVSQYAGTVLRQTSHMLVHTNGVLPSFFGLFGNVALSVSNGVSAFVTWTRAIQTLHRESFFQPSTSTSDSSGEWYSSD